MSPRLLILALAFTVLTSPCIAETAWHLVTPDEDERDRGAPHLPEAKGIKASGAPVIELQRPNLSRPVRNPVTIKVRFRARPGATIDTRTFQAKYGWLGIDITSRLLQHASLTKDALSAKDVDIPLGDHKVTLSISDTSGQVGTKIFQLSIIK